VIKRFEGDGGSALLVETLLEQKIVGGNAVLAERIAAISPPTGIPAGTAIIEQYADTSDLYLVVAGSFDIG
jgi:hypothetical protein